MKTGKVVLISFLTSVATGVVVYGLGRQQHKKIGVVDAVRLFDQFNMKKEMEAKEKMKLESIKKQVDSVERLLQLAQASRNEDELKKLTAVYGYTRKEFETEYQRGNQDINVQVWKRLNPAVEEYGKKNGLRLIIGANGMGSVLYNDEYYDLTNDLIRFVNKKYEEGS